MASILRKSLRNQLLSAARTTINLNRSTILSSKPTLTSPLPHHPSSSRLGKTPFFPQLGTVDPNLNVGFYPSFSFGHFLNPVSPNGLTTPEEVDDVIADESHKIWADSVKKKRKRKMNKHKLKKLRKRLRRKT
ncbi:PREDICTED: uncharacterized protein LOC109220034 [Nicotiana attenuata]|uniref:uncharacterized protein LOC109220034 n=1 Tax=Nicotiana attenuata TaxID=49451 RepID=UPI0009051B83|nr:PREDICTED: uncharacterized protein LOC109220034 [Nicotiana attenuata]